MLREEVEQVKMIAAEVAEQIIIKVGKEEILKQIKEAAVEAAKEAVKIEISKLEATIFPKEKSGLDSAPVKTEM